MKMKTRFRKFVERNCPTFFERVKEQNLDIYEKPPHKYIRLLDWTTTPESAAYWAILDGRWRNEFQSEMELIHTVSWHVWFGFGYIQVGCEMHTLQEWVDVDSEAILLAHKNRHRKTLEFIKRFAKEKLNES